MGKYNQSMYKNRVKKDRKIFEILTLLIFPTRKSKAGKFKIIFIILNFPTLDFLVRKIKEWVGISKKFLSFLIFAYLYNLEYFGFESWFCIGVGSSNTISTSVEFRQEFKILTANSRHFCCVSIKSFLNSGSLVMPNWAFLVKLKAWLTGSLT